MHHAAKISPLAAALLAALGTVPLAAQAATIAVTTVGDAGTATDCTLRQAIVTMNTLGATAAGCNNTGAAFGTNDTIDFDTAPTAFPKAGTNTIRLGFGQLKITAVNLTIDATANGNVTIDAQGTSGVINEYAAGASLALRHLTLSNGSAAIGGGIYCTSANVALTNSTLTGNSATIKGGGISCRNVTLTNSTLSGNSAPQGGGINSSGNLTLTNSTLSRNSATGTGTASNGGGIAVESGTVTLTNSTLSGNSANYGGGIGGNSASFASITLTNSTISANSASSFGGGIYMLSNSGDSITANNTIIAGNTQLAGGDVQGNVTSSSFSLIGGNPMLGALANNGGPTQTMLPQAGSPAIDAMLCSFAPPADQRGYIRPDPGSAGSPGLCDIGAVETGSIPDEIFKNGFE